MVLDKKTLEEMEMNVVHSTANWYLLQHIKNKKLYIYGEESTNTIFDPYFKDVDKREKVFESLEEFNPETWLIKRFGISLLMNTISSRFSRLDPIRTSVEEAFKKLEREWHIWRSKALK